jgi:3-hydroxybutyryl-CoA dehydrogenase
MPDARIDRIAVLGAGIMGHGIAHAAAAAGYQTRLYDVTGDRLDAAVASIAAIVAKGVELGKIDAQEAEAIKGRILPTTGLADSVQDAELVIEAVPEQMPLKLQILAEVERMAPPSAVLASNTSALSLTEMSAALSAPARLAGMHFFNPVHKMKLVEVVRALESSDATIGAILAVAARMGKETVVVRESAGFVTSRINAMIGNEAFYMLQEGVASARDIDKALKLGLNHPMGPFELADLVGLDTRLSVLEHLHRSFGDKFRPCPLLVQYVRAGRLGRKTGKGVYEY